ncbi:alpha/beta hydrolase [Ligilactobacillus ceti]|uniref:Alpha/beta hydrolase n=1 Tax=Ligilactobacillus ceti DSM 22408 TaxID=1122146 RepID=A0A0R2KGG7_9LACO|nr:alpha/beta hydrolase [Ligilactobacillus ceti]KRN88463.1 hypothetical protein IV53_GL000427 [Ligilactobacillus ceti DSM 22408]
MKAQTKVITGAAVLSAASFCGYKWQRLGGITKKNYRQVKNDIPTLFIHGYAGTRLSTGFMLRRFEKKGWGSKTCVIKVKDHQKIKIIGDPTVPGCFIQVLFDENRVSVMKQSNWLWRVMATLKLKYHVNEVNLVAHSMGGVVVMRYLSSHGNYYRLPRVNKVVTIGSPFNDSDPGKTTAFIESYLLTQKGPVFETMLFNRMRQHNFLVSPQIKFLNIAGDLGYQPHSDGAVSVNSVRSLRYLIKNPENYTEKIMYGKKAAHTLLHENPEVDQLIGEFLFNVKK